MCRAEASTATFRAAQSNEDGRQVYADVKSLPGGTSSDMQKPPSSVTLPRPQGHPPVHENDGQVWSQVSRDLGSQNPEIGLRYQDAAVSRDLGYQNQEIGLRYQEMTVSTDPESQYQEIGLKYQDMAEDVTRLQKNQITAQ